tara:strand:- start:853 stop:984 length:132 start_codon:yes stop_codon:yes gene_type:complete
MLLRQRLCWAGDDEGLAADGCRVENAPAATGMLLLQRLCWAIT